MPAAAAANPAQDAWDKIAQDKATALAKILAAPDKTIMIIVIAAHNDARGTVSLCHAVSPVDTTGAVLRQFIFATERKLTWLRDKLYRKA